MKKIGIMDAPASTVIASLKHSDMITIGDADLSVLSTTYCIDLTLNRAFPDFWIPWK